MDVLRYSATQAESYLTTQCSLNASCIPALQTCLVNRNQCLTTVCNQFLQVQASASTFDAAATCWVQVIEPCLLRQPSSTALWACIPTGSGWTGGFKVCRCAGNPQFNYGSCCAWTVPGGVTCARFQIWGAGGGSGAGHCCGGSPFGSTGAYASVIMPVTAGNTYTLCAGCAFACYPTRRNLGRVPGCPSWVQGAGLCNFCANGGQGSLGVWMAQQGKRSICKLAAFTALNYQGPCICCFGSHYCAQVNATCGVIPYVAGASYFGTTTTRSIVYGIRGMWPRFCHDTNHFGCQTHAPIYGFESTSQCGFCWTSGTCCGRVFSACCGQLQVPSAGGWGSIGMGGSYGVCGDMGKAGMVCVCFK